MPDSRVFISIIVPAHNSKDYLCRSLSALRHSDYPYFELIVVDDASGDQTRVVAQSYADSVIVLEKRAGPAKARNIGAQKGRGEIIFFVDADVEVAADTLSKVARAFEEDKEAAAIFGSYDASPAAEGFFSQYKNLCHYFVHQHARVAAKTFWSGCGAIRRDIFLKVGGFPEEYHNPDIEDVELGYNLVSGNHAIKLVKEIQVTHLKKWGFIGLIKSDILHRAIPWTRLAVKKGLPYDLNFKLADRMSGIFSLFLFLSLILMWRYKSFIFISIAMAGVLFYLNQNLYKFFSQKKGFAFTVMGILFHWFYFFYSSVVFACYATFLSIKSLYRRKCPL